MQTIEIRTELDIEELREGSWGGAPERIKRLTDSEIETIFFALEELSNDLGKLYTRTEINDIFWFEEEWIEELIGRKIIWSDEFAPDEEELELYRNASEYYDDLIEFWKYDLDFTKADKQILVSEYIRKEIGNDLYITENASAVERVMLKIFNERW